MKEREKCMEERGSEGGRGERGERGEERGRREEGERRREGGAEGITREQPYHTC